jgi:cell division protein FtsB
MVSASQGGFHMTSSYASAELEMLVTFELPMDDIVASLPYVLPMITLGVLLLLYQRHLTPDTKKRNLMLLIGILSFAVAVIAVFYASLGSMFGFGSWTTFVNGLQILTNLFFGTVLSSLVYVIAFTVILSGIAYYVISPPDPDLTALRDDLKSAKQESKTVKDDIKKLESENKRLNEFVSEKEDRLTALAGELDTIKAEVSERETSIALMEEQLKAKGEPVPVADEGMAEQLKMKDHHIASLESEIADLRITAAGTPSAAAPAGDDGIVTELSSKLKEAQTRWEDLGRRAEAATEVSDSVISDLVELISMVEGSGKDDGAKKALVTLIESLGRSMTRVAREVGDSHGEEPKVEMIGAILMVNEIVDTIKKTVR